MRYTPTWEPIAEALERVVATGLSKSDAQRDLCRAIADRGIAIRIHLTANHGLPARAISGSSLEIPPRLSPSHVDWKHSRPSEGSPLWLGPSQRPGEPVTLYIRDNFELMNRTVELIDVNVADVVRVFSKPRDVAKPVEPTEHPPKKQSNLGAKLDGAKRAIKALWPDGNTSGVTAKDRDRLINEWQKNHRLSPSSARTIQRALRSPNPHKSPGETRQLPPGRDMARLGAACRYVFLPEPLIFARFSDTDKGEDELWPQARASRAARWRRCHR